jgi:hypothetical protein
MNLKSLAFVLFSGLLLWGCTFSTTSNPSANPSPLQITPTPSSSPKSSNPDQDLLRQLEDLTDVSPDSDLVQFETELKN